MSLQKGLVLHQKLDKGSYNLTTKRFNDKTPYSNHGTSANAGVFDTDRMGHDNEVTVFNGTSDYVDCGGDESLQLMGDLTLSAWVKVSTDEIHGTAIGTIYNRIDYTSAYNIHFFNKIPRFTMGGGGSTWSNAISSDGALNSNWHHIVGSISGTNMKLYIDGVEKGTDSFSGNRQTPEKLTIGDDGREATRLFNGLMDDVRIYNRALSQDEITLLYKSYNPKLAIGSRQKGLVLDMPLRDPYTKGGAAGSEILTDRTPWSNDGTNHGATISSDPAVFNGTSDYIDIINSMAVPEVLQSLSDNITISAWFNASTVTGSASNWQPGHTIVELRQENTNADMKVPFSVGISYSKLFLGVTDAYTTGSNTAQGNTFLSIGTWYHVVMTISGDNYNIYLDGQSDGSGVFGIATGDRSVGNKTSNLKVGSRSKDNGLPLNFFDGSMDDVRIYNRALSESEIVEYYNETKGKY